jgi:hypothetical protein
MCASPLSPRHAQPDWMGGGLVSRQDDARSAVGRHSRCSSGELNSSFKDLPTGAWGHIWWNAGNSGSRCPQAVHRTSADDFVHAAAANRLGDCWPYRRGQDGPFTRCGQTDRRHCRNHIGRLGASVPWPRHWLGKAAARSFEQAWSKGVAVWDSPPPHRHSAGRVGLLRRRGPLVCECACAPCSKHEHAPGDFAADATRAIGEVHSRGHAAMVVGGSSMYIQLLTDKALQPVTPLRPSPCPWVPRSSARFPTEPRLNVLHAPCNMTGGAQVPRGDLRLRAELRAALQTDADWAAAFARLSTDRPELLRNARALSVIALKGCSAGWVAWRMGGRAGRGVRSVGVAAPAVCRCSHCRVL